MIEHLVPHDFSDLAPGALAVEHAGLRIGLDVTELRRLPPTPQRPSPFSMVLAGPLPMLGQGIHALWHPQHGRLELFMVPVGLKGDRVFYELVFN